MTNVIINNKEDGKQITINSSDIPTGQWFYGRFSYGLRLYVKTYDEIVDMGDPSKVYDLEISVDDYRPINKVTIEVE